MPSRIPAIAAALTVLAAAAAEHASAEVLNVAANGFEIRETAHSAAAPDKVYGEMLLPAQWWSSDHTFSGSAANLVLDARAGAAGARTCPAVDRSSTCQWCSCHLENCCVCAARCDPFKDLPWMES